MRRFLSIVALTLLVSGCGPIRDDKIDGPYRLWATDVPEQTHIAYALKGGAVGRIPARVVAVGHNADFITASVHPEGDHQATVFYYILRELDGPLVDPSVSVRGPMGETAFEQERSRLGLPVPVPIK